MNRRGFTIFELLAVLLIIGLALVVVLGSYTSWATVHALDGAVRTIEGGMLHARTIAKAKNTYVIFSYVTSDPSTNVLRQTSSYDIYLCPADTNGIVNPMATGYQFDTSIIPTTSQRLNRHILLEGSRESLNTLQRYGDICFSPEGNLVFEDGVLPSPHWIAVSTRKRFSVSHSERASEPLYRFIRVDYATGIPTVLKPGELDLNL